MLEPLLEPVQAKKDNKGVDRNGVRDHGYCEQYDLLPSIQRVDIDRIQSTLGRGTTG
jgi:hypothetical protein